MRTCRSITNNCGSYVKDVEAMGEFLLEQLTSLGVKAEKRAIGTHTLEGKEVDLPPVIIGQIGQDPKKVCVHSLHSLSFPIPQKPFPPGGAWIGHCGV